MRELSQMAVGRHDANTLGMTVFRVNTVASRVARERFIGDGLCASRAVRVQLEVQDFRVYVAKEVTKGSCLDLEVLGHESGHIDAFRRSHTRMEAAVTERAIEWAGQEAVFGPVAEVRAHLAKEPLLNASEIAHKLLLSDDQFHRAIDTDLEYQRLGAACGAAAASLFFKQRSGQAARN